MTRFAVGVAVGATAVVGLIAATVWRVLSLHDHGAIDLWDDLGD